MKPVVAFVCGIALASAIGIYIAQKDDPQPPVAEAATEAPVAAAAQESTPAAVEPATPVPPPPVSARPSPARSRRPAPAVRQEPVETARNQTPDPPPVVNAPPPPSPEPAAPASAPAVRPPDPPPPPKPNVVTIPAGTLLTVRLSEGLSSERNQAGDSFSATLDQPLVIDGFVIAERGARLDGRVVDSQQAGRVRGLSALALELTGLRTADGQTVEIETQAFEKQGETSKKQDAAKVGLAAGIGAAIGAIAGGGKGAAIGAGVGGAAGTGGVLATRGKAAELPVETRISFKLEVPVTVTEKIK